MELRVMASRTLFILTLLMLLLSAGWADSTRFFVRNREVQGKVVGGEMEVPFQSLSQYLMADELQRLKLGQSMVTVDQKVKVPLTDSGLVPLTELTAALGFTVRRGKDTGWVDLVPPSQVADEWMGDQKQGEEDGPDFSQRRPEYRLAGLRMKEINKTFPLSDDRDYNERVQRIGKRIADASPLDQLDWKFTVVETSVPNAACSGEGHVFVTTGLLELQLTDDELAGVLGHEVAHGVRRHPFKRLDLMQEQRRLYAKYVEYVKKRKELDEGQNSAGILTLQNLIREIETKVKSLDYRLKNLTEFGAPAIPRLVRCLLWTGKAIGEAKVAPPFLEVLAPVFELLLGRAEVNELESKTELELNNTARLWLSLPASMLVKAGISRAIVGRLRRW